MGSINNFYKPEEAIYCNDGREEALLAFMDSHPQRETLRNSPEAVLAAIDEYGRTKDFLMNVGKHKGKMVTDLIAQAKPKNILEIGCYVGYSAILFGNALRQAGGKKYTSLEMSPKFASISRAMIALAGLSDFVEIIEGPCRDSLRTRLPQKKAWDVIFLDHAKTSYLNDLKLCEELEFVAPGTIVLADDMVRPGNPAYSEYVRQSPTEKRVLFKRFSGGIMDGGISLGNPNLVYRTEVFEGLQPTGDPDSVEVSYCEGIENE